MGSNRNKLLGFFVWEGAKWYVRGRLPSRRRVLLLALLSGAGAAALLALARRSA